MNDVLVVVCGWLTIGIDDVNSAVFVDGCGSGSSTPFFKLIEGPVDCCTPPALSWVLPSTSAAATSAYFRVSMMQSLFVALLWPPEVSVSLRKYRPPPPPHKGAVVGCGSCPCESYGPCSKAGPL